jgi:cell wall-associated NlpC family hydrolase
MDRLLAVMILGFITACQAIPTAPVYDYSVGTGAIPRAPSSAYGAGLVSGHPQAVSDALDGYFSSWRGVRHRYGGQSRRGVDCSAFVQLTYRDVFGMQIPRTTREQSTLGTRVSKRKLAPGDLVFFKTGWFDKHVGVYVGGGTFIHASESKGVTKSSMQDHYWRKRYWKARRVL